MQIVQEAVLAPGSCYFTGASSGPFVDTGLDVDEVSPWGRVYLSVDYIAEMARAFGWVPPDEHDAVKAVAEQLTVMNRELSDRLEAWEHLATTVDEARAKLNGVHEDQLAIEVPS